MQCTAIWARVCLCQSLEHIQLVSRQMPNQCHYRAVCNILPRAIMQNALLRLTIIEHIAQCAANIYGKESIELLIVI